MSRVAAMSTIAVVMGARLPSAASRTIRTAADVSSTVTEGAVAALIIANRPHTNGHCSRAAMVTAQSGRSV
jgi:hypothetical protein